MKKKDLKTLKDIIGYEFRNERLLEEAMTHRSYAVENSLKYDNQRLEFLGDAVIQIIITEYLFTRYTEEDEGKLTKMRSALAQQSTLAILAKLIGIEKYIRMGKGEQKCSGHERTSTLCDAFESLAGAIYLDGGLTPAISFVTPLFETLCQNPDELLPTLNPKGMLQELSQQHFATKPQYQVTIISGPDHDRQFTVEVSIIDKILGTGTATSRKSAESMAAAAALSSLKHDDSILAAIDE